MAVSDVSRNIYYRHFDLSGGFPVIGLLGDFWQFDDQPATRLHFHNCLEIGYVFAGSGRLYVGDDTVPFTAPCIQVIPANLPHVDEADPGEICHAKWLYTDPTLLNPTMTPHLANEIRDYQNGLSGRACVIQGESHEDLFHLVEMVIREMEERPAHYQHVVRSLIQTLLLLLMREGRADAGTAADTMMRISAIFPAIAYVAENYMNEINIAMLARTCHLSVSHFRRLFKQILGVAPLDYIQMVRVERARVLLFNEDLSVTDIGLNVGFSTASSFIRQFRQIYGISPGQWRKKAQNEENPAVIEYFHQFPADPAQGVFR